MQVKLSAEQEQYMRTKMASGRYSSVEAVVAEALRVLRNVEEALPSAEDDLRREIQLGLDDIEAGHVSEWNVEDMKRRLRQRLRPCARRRSGERRRDGRGPDESSRSAGDAGR